MAKLTRDQFNKFNGNCKNGFSLDLYYFGIWGEKRCKKNVKFSDSDNFYEIIIEFEDKTEKFQKIGSVPVLIINQCIPTGTEGMYRVIELKCDEIGEMAKRRSVKVLQTLTNDYTDEKVVDMIKDLIAA